MLTLTRSLRSVHSSVPMKSSDSVAVQRLCLEGFRHAIHIAAQFYMELERDAFVQALTGFTGLLTGTRTLKARNVCMRSHPMGCSRLLTTGLAPIPLAD
jgi:brefeldin A-inhibited guanine nucleotide-exchange protein